jgi:hypothetical protein
MEDKKIGSLKKIKISDNRRIVFGTNDRKNCSSFFLRIEMKMKPMVCFETSINHCRRRLKLKTYTASKSYFEGLKTHIFDVDYPYVNSKTNKKESFVAIEFTLFGDFNWKDVLFNIEKMSNDFYQLIESVESLKIK